MVRDGYFYGIGSAIAAGLIIWLAWWPYAVPVLLLGAFCLWFFRDPERRVPDAAGAIVSPGDGKVTDVSILNPSVNPQARISIFLNVFNVHVNRTPIGGTVRDVRYQRGKFLNAMGPNSAEENEQSIITVEGEGRTVVFKQIAGLIARRIICHLKSGDTVARGQRMGLIKFGSRVDVIFDADASIQVKPGDHVKGGATILALLPVPGMGKNLGSGQAVATQTQSREVSSWKG
ncbi:MAG TPA: phosphatidylserine decarboxylase family protein [Terriglobales bacterium]|nr:phosphatidylserine decarboxylase family protein [Terriglobales bacterium]